MRQGTQRLFRASAALLCLLLAAAGWAESIAGIVATDAARPIAAAMVVLVEADRTTTTDAEGRFRFDDIVSGDYVLLVLAEGYEERRLPCRVPLAEPAKVVLHPVVVDMGEVVIEADAGPKDSVTYTAEELGHRATGGDPIRALALAPGVYAAESLLMGYGGLGSESDGIPQAPMAVRGTNPLANTFYFDYIAVPTLLHLRGLPTPRSAVSPALCQTVEIMRGGYGVPYGPGYGGIFIFRPGNGIPAEPRVTLRTSLLNLDAAAALPLGSRVGLQVSIRKSLYELTWLPLIDALDGPPPSGYHGFSNLYGEGDYGARLLVLPSPRHLLSVDVLGLVDYGLSRWSGSLPSEPVVDDSDLYTLAAEGARWSALWGTSGSNTLYAYSSLVSRRAASERSTVSAESGSSQQQADTVERLAGGERLEYGSETGLGAAAGAEGAAIHLGTSRDAEVHGALNDESHLAYTAWCSEASGYAELRYRTPGLEASGGARADYFGAFGQIVPSVRGQLTMQPVESFSLGLSGGTYPGMINYLELLSRREWSTDGSSAALQQSVSRSLCGTVRAQYTARGVSLAAEGYATWMRGLSGYDLQYSRLLQALEIESEPEQGLSWGAEITSAWAPRSAMELSGAYEYGWVRYRVSGVWVPASFDVPHTLRMTLSWRPTEALLVAANLRASAGYPFTPVRVTGYVDGEGFTVEQGAANSARDWVPGMALDLHLAADVHAFGATQRLFVDIANLLSGPERATPASLDYWVGMDTRRVADRRYRFPIWEALVVDFGVETPLGHVGQR